MSKVWMHKSHVIWRQSSHFKTKPYIMWGRSLLDNELLDLKLIHLFCSFHKNIYWTLNSKSSHACRMNYAWRIYLTFIIALRYRHYQPHFSVSSHCLSHNLKGPAWPEPPTFLPFLISLSVLLPATPCDPAPRLPYGSSCTSVPRLPQGFCISCAFGQENPLPHFSHDLLLRFAFPPWDLS